MNEAEHEGHQQVRLTLRLPPRAYKTCALCKYDFVTPLLLPDNNGEASCHRCGGDGGP
jgi:hypothetical protein